MIKKTYYIENSYELETALATLAAIVPCFINREYIEMNYSEIEITARQEDFRSVENLLSALV